MAAPSHSGPTVFLQLAHSIQPARDVPFTMFEYKAHSAGFQSFSVSARSIEEIARWLADVDSASLRLALADLITGHWRALRGSPVF